MWRVGEWGYTVRKTYIHVVHVRVHAHSIKQYKEEKEMENMQFSPITFTCILYLCTQVTGTSYIICELVTIFYTCIQV